MRRSVKRGLVGPPGRPWVGLGMPLLLALLLGPACKEPPRSVPRTLGPNTRVLQVGPLQVGFDLMVMGSPRHDVMVNRMKMNRKMPASHALMISILDAKTHKRIPDARVTVTMSGPGDRKVRRDASVMTGKGMYHYAVHFDLPKKAVYQVAAKIRAAGTDYVARTTFDTSKVLEK